VTGAYKILPATWHDLTALGQLEKVCFPKDAWPLWDLIGVLTLPGIVRLKASADEHHMVGFIASEKRLGDGVSWITTLAVLPAYRRQGIARALLATCEAEIETPRIRLTVRRSNIGASQLYKEADYHLLEVWPHYYQDGEDGLVMEKKVNHVAELC
jgi:ribosomal protein S18 acetylase RimI-like enzyme